MKMPRHAFLHARVRPWGLLSAAGSIAVAASVFGFLGSLNWIMDLCSHFRVQYFIGLTAIALLLLIPRMRKTAAFFGAMAAVNLALIVPMYFGKQEIPVDHAKPLKAMLINVNTGAGDPNRVADSIRKNNPDILVIEEVNTSWLRQLAPALSEYSHSKSVPRDDNFGIAIYSRYPFSGVAVAYIGEADVPSLIAEIETPQGKCTVIGTHPPPPAGPEYSRWRNSQLAKLPQTIRRATSPVLLLGDLNVTPWCIYFKRLLADSGLRDSAKGRGLQPTWPAFNPFLLIPLDHCLHAPEINIISRTVGQGVGSDHFPLVVEFVIAAPKSHLDIHNK